jgi:hypothetical protein
MPLRIANRLKLAEFLALFWALAQAPVLIQARPRAQSWHFA